MLGFSIQKLLFTAAVIAAVWYGFKYIGRMREIREKEGKDKLKRTASGSGGSGGSAAAASGDAEDMVECTVCGAFVASVGAKNCGQADCPYPG